MDWKQLGVVHDSWVGQDTVWLFGYSTSEYPDTFRVISTDQWQTDVQPIIETADPDSIFEDNAGIWHYSSRNDDNTWSKIRFQKVGMVGQPYDSSESNTSSSHPRLGAFVQVKYHLSDRIYANIGLRAGYLEYTDFKWLSPRLGINYAFTPMTALSLAYGRHYQSPNLLYLAFDSDNRTLKSKYNDQVVLGIEHLFSLDTRGTFEAYWKEYQDIPVDYSSTTLDSSDASSRLVNKGYAKSYGIEFFLQKKMAKDLFGTFSYSWYRAFMQDPRSEDEKFYPQMFDFQHVASIVGGYRIPLKGSNIVPISKRNGLVRFIAKALGWGSDELELSVRYRYVGGKPYTPLQYDHNVQRWYEDPSTDYNTKRLIAYHRFDLMILWHSHFKNFNLVSYFDLQNVFNRENIWDVQYNADGTTSDIYQYQVMPVGGFTIEF